MPGTCYGVTLHVPVTLLHSFLAHSIRPRLWTRYTHTVNSQHQALLSPNSLCILGFFWLWPSWVLLAYPVLLKPFDLFLPVMFLSRSMVISFHSGLGTILWTNLTLSYQVHFIANWCSVPPYLFCSVSIGEQEKRERFPWLAANCSPGLSCTRCSTLIEWRWLSFLKITFKFDRISMHVKNASCNYLS